jgi:hypothetical protein
MQLWFDGLGLLGWGGLMCNSRFSKATVIAALLGAALPRPALVALGRVGQQARAQTAAPWWIHQVEI